MRVLSKFSLLVVVVAVGALAFSAAPASASFTCNTGARCTVTLRAGRTSFDVARLATVSCEASTISGPATTGVSSFSTLGRFVDFKTRCRLDVLGSEVCRTVTVNVDPNDRTWTISLPSSTPAAPNSWDVNVTIGNVTIVVADCSNASFAGTITVASGEIITDRSRCVRYTQMAGVLTVRCGTIRITSTGGLRTLGTPNSTFTGSYTVRVDGTGSIPTVS